MASTDLGRVDGLAAVRALLAGLGRAIAEVKVTRDSRLELYATRRGLVILNVLHERDALPSWDVYVPVTTDLTCQGTVDALAAYLEPTP